MDTSQSLNPLSYNWNSQRNSKFEIILKSFFKVKITVTAQSVKNPTSIHEDAGSIPDLAPWLKDPAVARIWSLTQELPYAMGAAEKKIIIIIKK